MRLVARWDLLAETEAEAKVLAEYHRKLYASKVEKCWVLPLPKPAAGRPKGGPSGP